MHCAGARTGSSPSGARKRVGRSNFACTAQVHALARHRAARASAAAARVVRAPRRCTYRLVTERQGATAAAARVVSAPRRCTHRVVTERHEQA
eukprot:4670701-Pleurochrysis_carterae.AAC.1